MDEMRYRGYYEECERAQALYRDLRELYDRDLSNNTLFARAMVDKIITEDERRLLSRYYH